MTETVTEARPNYLSWQRSAWDWYYEIQSRRETDPTYDGQERYLRAYFQQKAAECLRDKGRPLRVLEVGCGFGRHLKYLHQVEGVEVYGCDQSPGMLSVGDVLLLGRFPELADRIRLVEATQPLPYGDGSFDIAFTVSVLLHVCPEDLAGRVAEMRRVATDVVLNLELPPSTHTFLWDQAHDGCWLHDLIGAQQAVGPCDVTVDCDELAPRVSIYEVRPSTGGNSVRLKFGDRWVEEPEELEDAMVDAALTYAKFCQTWVQDKFRIQIGASRRLAGSHRELQREHHDLHRQMNAMRAALQADLRRVTAERDRARRRVRRLLNTRAVRFSYWVARHKWMHWPVASALDLLGLARRAVLRALGRRAPAEQAPAAGTDEADEAESPQGAQEGEHDS